MKKLLSVICLILAIAFAMGAIGLITTDPATAIIGAACALLFFWAWRKLRKPKQPKASRKAKASAPDKHPQYQHVQIRVAGVTFRNDDGTDRQQLLRKIKFGDAPFQDNDNLDVLLDSYLYKGDPAIRVMVNGYQIGNVPKEQVAEVQQAMTKPGTRITVFDVVGGGKIDDEQINYGALIVLRYDA